MYIILSKYFALFSLEIKTLISPVLISILGINNSFFMSEIFFIFFLFNSLFNNLSIIVPSLNPLITIFLLINKLINKIKMFFGSTYFIFLAYFLKNFKI